jgi:hypothetical protein
MKILSSKNICLLAVAAVLVFAAQTTVAQQNLPNPQLLFLRQEYYEASGKKLTRYVFEIVNKDQYPAELFAAAPDLPPCGTNKNASRTWVDVYDSNGKRLYGFCAFTKPGDLSKIWFALDQEEVPPSWVYVEFRDRKTNTKYKSNLAETTN